MLFAYKFPKLWKFSFLYQMITMMAKELMPIDYGQTHLLQLMFEYFLFLISFTYMAKIDIVVGNLVIILTFIGCRSVLYNDE